MVASEKALKSSTSNTLSPPAAAAAAKDRLPLLLRPMTLRLQGRIVDVVVARRVDKRVISLSNMLTVMVVER